MWEKCKTVTGGRTGNTLWLSLGSRGLLRLQGHFTQHGLVATAQTFSPRGHTGHSTAISRTPNLAFRDESCKEAYGAIGAADLVERA